MNIHIKETNNYPRPSIQQKQPKMDHTFSNFIKEAQNEKRNELDLKISNHAQKRMDERGFLLAENDLSTINSAVNELNGKGSKNSLLIYKDLALVASIHNRTIITALNRDEVDTITNIDSTKFIKE